MVLKSDTLQGNLLKNDTLLENLLKNDTLLENLLKNNTLYSEGTHVEAHQWMTGNIGEMFLRL